MADLKSANSQLSLANSRLGESSQLKSAFIEVASHEFNTPITLVLGLSELLLLTKPDREPAEKRIIEQIATSAKQLAKLVANTLTLMRSDDFRQTIKRTERNNAAKSAVKSQLRKAADLNYDTPSPYSGGSATMAT